MLFRTRLRLAVFLLLAGTALVAQRAQATDAVANPCVTCSKTVLLCDLNQDKKDSWCGAGCGAGSIYKGSCMGDRCLMCTS